MTNKKLSFLAKLAFSTLVLALIARSVDMAEFWASLGQARGELVVLAVCMFFPAQIFGAYRWYQILQALDLRSNFGSVVRYTFIGQFSALFLPGQVSGDVVRALTFAHQHRQHERVFLSVLLDKSSFLATLGFFALAGTLVAPDLQGIPGLLLASGTIFGVALAGFLALSFYRNRRLLDFLSHRVEGSSRKPGPIEFVLRRAAVALSLPRLQLADALRILFLASGLQVLNTIGSLVMAHALAINVGVLDWVAIVAVVAIIQIFPLSVGGLGVREGAFVLLLALYGVDPARATAFSLLTFVLVAFLVTLGWLVAEQVSRGSRELENPYG